MTKLYMLDVYKRQMFAPAMMKDDHKAYMPYVDVYPTFVPAYETNEEILKKVVADLKEAKRMLAQCDITEEHREWMAINPRMLGIDPVSYTHLDVYKRQREYCPSC